MKKQIPIKKKLTLPIGGLGNVEFQIGAPVRILRLVVESNAEIDAAGSVVSFGLSTRKMTNYDPHHAGLISYDQDRLEIVTSGSSRGINRHVQEMFGYPILHGQKVYGWYKNSTAQAIAVNLILDYEK